jgi:hypothetical protein
MNNHLVTWPGLTVAQVRKYLPVSVPMHLGHMDQTRANQQSTHTPCPPVFDTDQDTKPTPCPDRTDHVFVALHEVTGKVFSDQTGRFPLTSNAGQNYLLLAYGFDSNYIHAEPIKSRSGPDILHAYQTAHALFTSRGLRPKLQRLDNEASNALLQFMASQHIDVQLSPPQVHRRNAAERAIPTYTNHFVAGL